MTNLKRIFVGVVVLAVMLSAVLVIPSGATYVSSSFDKPCSCGRSFSGSYGGGIVYGAGGAARASANVTHICDGITVYVSTKCWLYTSNYNTYTSRTFTSSDQDSYNAVIDMYIDNDVGGEIAGYNLRAVENYYSFRILCEGEEFTIQRWTNDGNVPMSIQPPVVTE